MSPGSPILRPARCAALVGLLLAVTVTSAWLLLRAGAPSPRAAGPAPGRPVAPNVRPSAEAPGAAVLAPWTPLPLDNLSIPWPRILDEDRLTAHLPAWLDQGWPYIASLKPNPQDRIVSPNLIIWARVEETAPPPGPLPPNERVVWQFDQRCRDVRLHVDRVLFGYWPYPALTVSLPLWAAFGDASAGEERHLFKLISGKSEGDRARVIAYAVSPADEEAAVVAEADARLHYYALAASRVFVGTRMALGKTPACSTEVVRTLSGGQLRAGARRSAG